MRQRGRGREREREEDREGERERGRVRGEVEDPVRAGRDAQAVVEAPQVDEVELVAEGGLRVR